MKPLAKAGAIQAAHQEHRPSAHSAGSGADTDERVGTITALDVTICLARCLPGTRIGLLGWSAQQLKTIALMT